MAPIALLQGFLEKFGIMTSIFYISGGFWLPRGTPKIMKIHENLSLEPPSAPNWLPGPSQDPPGLIFHDFPSFLHNFGKQKSMEKTGNSLPLFTVAWLDLVAYQPN